MKTIKDQFCSVCKIQIELTNYSTSFGSGFFCKLQKKNSKEFFYALITSDNVISEKAIEKGEVKIYFNNDKICKIIKFFESRLYLINKQYGVTIIEIKDNDGLDLNNFLEIDDNENYENEIYILYYKKNIGVNISKGFINEHVKKDNIIFYNCLTDSESCGSPIINPKNNKVICVHTSNFIVNGMSVGFGDSFKNAVKEYIYIINSLKNDSHLYDFSNSNINNENNVNEKILENIIPKKLRDNLDLSNILGESGSFLGSSLDIKPLIDSNNLIFDNIKEFCTHNNLSNEKLFIEKKDRFRINNNNFYLDNGKFLVDKKDRFRFINDNNSNNNNDNNIWLDENMSVCKVQVDDRFGTGFLCKFSDSKGKNFFIY